jgi:hypothetical protein
MPTVTNINEDGKRKYGGKNVKRISLLIALLFSGIILCYSEQDEFYREFRYRVVKGNTLDDTLRTKTPPVFIANNYLVVQEYRNVNSRNGLGRGGWKESKVLKASIQPTYHDVVNIFMELPESWVEDGYRASLVPTADNRSFWWDSDGTFHYYVVYKRISTAPPPSHSRPYARVFTR